LLPTTAIPALPFPAGELPSAATPIEVDCSIDVLRALST
jgi:hypothetical protein